MWRPGNPKELVEACLDSRVLWELALRPPLSPEAQLGQDSSLSDAPAGLGILLGSLGPGLPLRSSLAS